MLAETSVPLLHLRHAVHPPAKLETFQKAVEASSTRLGRSYKQRSICFLLRDPLISKVLCALFLWPLPAGGGPTGRGGGRRSTWSPAQGTGRGSLGLVSFLSQSSHKPRSAVPLCPCVTSKETKADPQLRSAGSHLLVLNTRLPPRGFVGTPF